MNTTVHSEKHPWAGKKVLLKEEKVLNGAGTPTRTVIIEDWADRVLGCSWYMSQGNPACLVYAIRGAREGLPIDDEVVYGKDENWLGVLVHVSELDGPEE